MKAGWARAELPRPDPGTLLFALALCALAGWNTWDHVAWVMADRSSLLFNDSPMHLLGAAESWRTWQSSPSWVPSIPYGTYPPGVYVVALPFLEVLGVSEQVLRISGAVFTGLLVLGAGIFSARVAGRFAGLAAAALVVTYPEVWVQRTEIHMDLPLAGMVILAFSLLPSPHKPGTPWLALAGGLAMTGALFTKQAMLPIGGLGMAWLVSEALVRVGLGHRRGEVRPALVHLRDVALCAAPILALAGPYYYRAYPKLVDALSHTWNVADVPQGSDWILAKLSMLAWLKNVFLPAPHCWALGVGLLCLPWIWRRRPLMGPLLAGLLGGMYQYLTYVDPHERHFVPLIPIFLVLGVAPLGLLRGSVVRRALQVPGVLAAIAYGLIFTWSWRDPELEPEHLRMALDGHEFGRFQEPKSFAWVVDYLVARPTAWWAWAPLPSEATWASGEVIEVLAADWHVETKPSPLWYAYPHAAGYRALVLGERYPADRSLAAAAAIRGEYRYDFYGLQPGELPGHLARLRTEGLPQAGLYLITAGTEEDAEAIAQTDAWVKDEGFVELHRWKWTMTTTGLPHDVVLYAHRED